MKDHFGLPGVGGSLGECAVCGKPFLLELILGKSPIAFSVNGCKQTLYCHGKCEATLRACKTFLDLPPESALRAAFEKQTK